jgi:hypothetical protein
LLAVPESTADSLPETKHKHAFSRLNKPEVCLTLPPPGEGAGNAGCLLHPRSRVQWCKELRTRAYRYSRSTPAFPAQWVDGLCRAPWRRIRLASIAAGLMAQSIRSDRIRHRQLGTSHGCRDHTVLPYASAPYVLRAGFRSQDKLALRLHLRADAIASTTSRLAFVTIAIRPSCRDGTARK